MIGLTINVSLEFLVHTTVFYLACVVNHDDNRRFENYGSLRMMARAASFAILIGSGIEPCRVKQLIIDDASLELKPQYRTKINLPVFNTIFSLWPSL